jgi:hypothetical protein
MAKANRFNSETWIPRIRFAGVIFFEQTHSNYNRMDTKGYLLRSVEGEKSKEMRQTITYHRLGYLYRAHPLYILANLPPFFFLGVGGSCYSLT